MQGAYKLDWVALLVTDTPPANSTTLLINCVHTYPHTHIHPLDKDSYIVNLSFGCINNQRIFSTRQNPDIWGALLYITVPYEPIMQF